MSNTILRVEYDKMRLLSENCGDKRAKAQTIQSSIRVSEAIFRADGLQVREAMRTWIKAYLETRQIQGSFGKQPVWIEDTAREGDVFLGYDYQLQDWVTITMLTVS